MNLSQQYLRRDILEINGITNSVSDDGIEDEVIEIFKEAKVNVNAKILKSPTSKQLTEKGKRAPLL